MATKDQLRGELLSIEPDNVVAASSSASHSELSAELRNARRRAAPPEPVDVTVLHREEFDNKYSWVALLDGVKVHGPIFSSSIPYVGCIFDLESGRKAKVISAAEGLEVLVRDLADRDPHDPNRIYETPKGTEVKFKRVEKGRTILFSFKSADEIMLPEDSVLTVTNSTARPKAEPGKKMTQKVLAAFLIAKYREDNGRDIIGKDLTEALRQAFPDANIGDRHGPHYLSLSRKGKLCEPPDSDPRDW